MSNRCSLEKQYLLTLHNQLQIFEIWLAFLPVELTVYYHYVFRHKHLRQIASRCGLKTAKLPKYTAAVTKKVEKRKIMKSEKLLKNLFSDKKSSKRKSDQSKMDVDETANLPAKKLSTNEQSIFIAPSKDETESCDSKPTSFLSSIQAIFAATDLS